MSETSHRNIDRRMVMTLATGILAAGVTPAGAASSQEPSREFLACVAAYQERARNAGRGDEVLYRLDEEFAEAIDRFLDKSARLSRLYAPRSISRVVFQISEAFPLTP